MTLPLPRGMIDTLWTVDGRPPHDRISLAWLATDRPAAARERGQAPRFCV
jgi:hypothetical protein